MIIKTRLDEIKQFSAIQVGTRYRVVHSRNVHFETTVSNRVHIKIDSTRFILDGEPSKKFESYPSVGVVEV